MAIYPTSGTSGMVGFAAAGKTTGGTGGTVVTVKTLADLQKHIGGSDRKIVVVAANISASKKTVVSLGANKTLVGSFAANTLTNLHLKATASSSNVILQNLTIAHSAGIKGNDDIQIYLNYGSRYWVDHVTFPGHAYSSKDGALDKLLYVGAKADYVTISNCVFKNHLYGLILGQPADDDTTAKNYKGYPHLTMVGNVFDNVNVRAPGLMRHGYFHVYNNTVNKANLAFTIAKGANIYSEANAFSSVAGILDDKANGNFTDVGSVPAVTGQKSGKATWTPSSNYKYNKRAAAAAKALALKSAGARNGALTFMV